MAIKEAVSRTGLDDVPSTKGASQDRSAIALLLLTHSLVPRRCLVAFFARTTMYYNVKGLRGLSTPDLEKPSTVGYPLAGREAAQLFDQG